MREESDAAKEGKTMGIMDVAPLAVEEAFARSGCDVMIHGHTHRPDAMCTWWTGASASAGCCRTGTRRAVTWSFAEGVRAVDAF
jgi:hypothetical protein